MLLIAGVCCYLLLPLSNAYPTYQEQIPNGNNVPHTCKSNYRWPGVGHNNPKGGGDRNAFGIDFKTYNFKWTRELCQKDSDGDGKSNGQELGDPNCEWSPGQVPSRTVNITHPGVCDPYNSSLCSDKNAFLSCSLDEFEGCEAIKNPNVTFLDLKFNRTDVPAVETTYMCMTFDLPRDSDYHIIANEPLIDNNNVLHHMLVYACNDDDDFVIGTPSPCGMSTSNCAVIISGWTVGLPGQCFGPRSGYRIGQNGYKRVRLEVHYNNPERVPSYTDASGIRLHIQPALPEVQDMVTFITGQTQLLIPPGQKRVNQIGLCPSGCSKLLLNKPIHVMAAVNHMHYMGRSMMVELFRDGEKIANITYDNVYSYDSPITHSHNPPIEIRPGDEIKTTCVYSSLNKDHYVLFGEATSDEMCFGFLYTYPKDAVNYKAECDAHGPFSPCDFKTGQPVAGCDWAAFTDLSNPNTSMVARNLEKKCSLNGLCRPECREYLMTFKDHPCLIGEASTYVKRRMEYTSAGLKFLGRLTSCKLDQAEVCPVDRSHDGAKKTVAVSALLVLSTVIYVLVV